MKQLINNNDFWAMLYGGTSAFFLASGWKGGVIMAFCFLLVLDLLTGIRKSYKLNVPITPNKAIKGIIDKLSLLCVPLAISLMGMGVEMSMSWIVITSLALMNVFLTYGIISNIYTAYTGEAAEQRDGMTVFIKWLLTYVSRLGDSLVNVESNKQPEQDSQQQKDVVKKQEQEKPTNA